MSERVAPAPFGVTHYSAALYSLAALLAAAALVLPRPLASPLGLLAGWVAACVLLRFAVHRYLRARRFVKVRARPTPGRIVEVRQAEKWILDLPGDGLEPWGTDAWIVGIASSAAWAISTATGRSLIFVFVGLLVAALAARLLSSRGDRIRIELGRDGFRVESSEGGRIRERISTGPLMPELQADALTLWSVEGRIGVLRGELLPEERAWLAAQLAAFAERAVSGTGDAQEQVDQREARDDGQSQQPEHAK